MSGPKNNLEDVLRRRPRSAGILASSTSTSSSTHSKISKFKPAVSTPPSVTLRKNTTGALPSFSTPGFHKANVSSFSTKPIQTRDIIDLSSVETTPINPSPIRSAMSVKRTSSDLTVPSDQQSPSFKRVKKDVAFNKENLSFFEGNGTDTVRDKGKAKDLPQRHHRPIEDEPWRRMEIDEESNPFARLDRDYPQHAAPSVSSQPSPKSCLPAPTPNANHSDLNSKSHEMLKTLQCSNSDFKFKIMDSIMEYVTLQNKNHDVTLLNTVNAVIDDRINAIRTAIAAHERGEKPSLPATGQDRTRTRPPSLPHPALPPSSRNVMPPPPALTLSSTSASTTTLFVASTPAHREVVSSTHYSDTRKVREVIPDDDDEEVVGPGSDDYLWDTVGDVPMEDLEDDYSTAGPSNSKALTIGDPELTSLCTPAIQPAAEQTSTPYYKEVTCVLKSTFKLESFRPNQLEAINATMSGKDVFLLMPTGGGKSLCYQLPSVCKSGSTRGVTVVVSPLIALMNDQVTSLKNKNVDVEVWNSENSSDDAYAISRRLNGRQQDLPCMLYLTPEKLSENLSLKAMLGRLYDSGVLARFVIDEAHCISTWGRDFRDAYAKLDCLRTWYPTVPIMALTATANESVIKNIIDRLNIPNCVFLKQSFNRPNLHYDVREKKKNTVLKEIATFIKTRHPNETGIIYCFARAHCEQVAQALRDDFGLRAEHYHAGMPQAEKKKAQDMWQSGKAQIIVSTIAFGMGIDKKDVRFVVHHTMPKTMDGYYQETGRAGRDGRPADCILFYQYGDAKVLMEQIARDKDDGTTPLSEEDKTRLIEEVKKVMEYCTNISRCRRVQVLRYFNEVFDARDCHRGCDVCMDDGEVTTWDVSTAAIDAVNLVKSMIGNNSMTHCKAVFVGSKKREVVQRGHNELLGHGKGTGLGQKAVDQLFEELVAIDAFREQPISNAAGWSNNYLQLGPRADEVLKGKKKVTIYVKAGPTSERPSKKTTKRTASKPAVPAKNNKKSVVLEKKLSLYQADDFLGFSDDEGYDAYTPTEIDEDDEIVEASSPKPKAWPLVHSAQERVVPLRPSPSIEVIEDGRDGSLSASDVLHLDLKALRRQLVARDGLASEADVFDDMFLLRLSLTPPSDAHNFKELLKDHSDINMNFVQDKWSKYGKNFLQVCINSKLAPPPARPSTAIQSNISFDSAGMHERFDYQEAAASASKPSRTFKFAKPTGMKG